MRRLTVLIAAGLVLICGNAYAQFIQTTTQGISTAAGTGARARGMGGAFIAVADDASAAAWNPAGLAEIERPELSLTGEWYEGDRVFDGFWDGTWDAELGSYPKQLHHVLSQMQDDGIIFVTGTYPFKIGDRALVTQLSYRRLSTIPNVERTTSIETGRFNELDLEVSGTGHNFGLVEENNFTGGYDTFSLSLAYPIFETLRLGVTLSYVEGDIEEYYNGKYTDFAWDLGTKPVINIRNATHTFTGTMAEIGLQWDFMESLTIGAVYYSSMSTDLKYGVRRDRDCDPQIWGPTCGVPTANTSEGDLKWPDAWGVGLAWRPTTKWVFALDYSQYNWSEAKVSGLEGASWDSDGRPETVPFGVQTFPFYGPQNDTWRAAIGGEFHTHYLGVGVPMRFGFFQERLPALSTDYTLDNDPPAGPTYDGVALGIGLVHKGFQIDLGWEHLSGSENYPITAVDEGERYVVNQKSYYSGDRFLATLTYRF